MQPGMSSWNCEREQERQKREKYLQRRVQETLCLSPPAQVSRTYTPSLEEQKATARQYKSKLRINRILQVRAQETLFASQRVSGFRKTEDCKMVLNHLKDVWRNDQRQHIANLEQEYAKSCMSIGVSHEAALSIERNRAAKEEFAARQAEESRCWDTLRFEKAIHKERELNDLRERGDCAPTLRRKIIDESVSNIERSFARRYNHGHSKPKPHEKQAYGCSHKVNPLMNHDVVHERLNKKTAGCPGIDFKDTHLHPRFDIQQGRSDGPSAAVVSRPEQEEIDAWRAADARRESIKCEKVHQIEVERLLNERQLQRGNAATAKLLNDQRIAMLEHDVEEAFRQGEREKDRVHAAINPGINKRATSTGQQRRIIYTKHKISNPLSCPGLPHTSLACSRCRGYVELIPSPPRPVHKEPTPEFTIECEPDAEPDFNILVRPKKRVNEWPNPSLIRMCLNTPELELPPPLGTVPMLQSEVSNQRFIEFSLQA